MIGCLVVIALLAAIIIRVLLVARRAETPFHCYVCVGVAAMLIFQTVVNIGLCLFVMPCDRSDPAVLQLRRVLAVDAVCRHGRGVRHQKKRSPVVRRRAGPWGERKELPNTAGVRPAVFFCIFPAGGKKLAVHPIQYRRYDRL